MVWISFKFFKKLGLKKTKNLFFGGALMILFSEAIRTKLGTRSRHEELELARNLSATRK